MRKKNIKKSSNNVSAFFWIKLNGFLHFVVPFKIFIFNLIVLSIVKKLYITIIETKIKNLEIAGALKFYIIN